MRRVVIFLVPVLGGTVDKLSGPLATGGFVVSYALSPDGTRVAYVAGQDTADQFEVYSVLMAGAVMPSTSDRAEEQSASLSTQAAASKLNPSFPAQADAGSTLWISPDSAYVLYTADVNIDEAFELYSVPIDGGTAVQLNGALVTEGDVDTATAPLFSADSRTVIYRADQQTNDRYELYAVPITGGPALKVNDPVSGYGITLARLSPNGNHLIFGGQSGGATHERLWSKPMGLGPVVDLFPGLALDDTIDSFCSTFSPDGRWLAFSVHDLTTQDGVAYVARVNGREIIPVGGPFAAGRGVESCSLAFYPNGAGLIYAADQDTDDVLELYTVSLKDIVAPPTPTVTPTPTVGPSPIPCGFHATCTPTPTPPTGAHSLHLPVIQQGGYEIP